MSEHPFALAPPSPVKLEDLSASSNSVPDAPDNALPTVVSYNPNGVPAPSSATSSSYQIPPPPLNLAGKTTSSGAVLTGGYNVHKIYIGNLPETATLADLEDCFGQLGQCTCSIKRGFGFVEYTDPASAHEAVARYNEGHFLGAQIKVELSHARQPPKIYDDPKAPSRNPPGSDRPSDSRKPMHINGPPGQEKLSRRQLKVTNGMGPYNNYGPPPPPPPDFLRRDGPPPPDRYIPGPPGGRDMHPFLPPRADMPPYDRYRDDYARGPPPPAFDPRYPPPRDFERDLRYPPVPLPPREYEPDTRDMRYQPRDPYPHRDPYYDAPPRDYPYPLPRGGGPPPSSGPPPPLLPGVPSSPYLGYEAPRYDIGGGGYPPIDGPYDPRGAPLTASGGGPPLGPRGDDRNPRYNPYARSPPRDDRRPGIGLNGGSYGGRSPPRGAGPPPERRRSLSPPRRDYASGPPAPYGGGYDARAPYGRPGSPPRYGQPPPEEQYNPRR